MLCIIALLRGSFRLLVTFVDLFSFGGVGPGKWTYIYFIEILFYCLLFYLSE